MRRGVALTLNYVVIAVILLSLVLLVLSVTTGAFDPFERFTEDSMAESELQAACEQCKIKQRNYCADKSDTTNWGTNVQYQGEDCATLMGQCGYSSPYRCGDTY